MKSEQISVLRMATDEDELTNCSTSRKHSVSCVSIARKSRAVYITPVRLQLLSTENCSLVAQSLYTLTTESRMKKFGIQTITVVVGLAGLLLCPSTLLNAQVIEGGTSSFEELSGEELYETACSNCHGLDGAGAPQYRLGFEDEVPDFTECTFATREPDADWVAVAHEGGPLRVFSERMPAFGDAIDEEDLGRVMEYIRTLCTDNSWPRGELNFPRAMFTEKAYPEDEAVFTTGASLDGPGSISNEFVYETRLGAASQLEIAVPFVVQEIGEGAERNWASGVGDIVVGLKRAFFHSLKSGSILSAAAELKIPTGDEERGFGSGTTAFEGFVSHGQALPAEFFLQVQGIVEIPFDADRAENEGAIRAALGRSFTEGQWGRTWTPMVEVLAGKDLVSGSTVHWDVVPQFQVTLNQRQHIMANLALRVPVNETEGRHPRVLVYLLWDWFDGGFFDGW